MGKGVVIIKDDKNVVSHSKTVAQVRHLFWLFKELGIEEENRADVVFSYTEGRTDKVSELEFIEAQTIIRRLEGMRRGSFKVSQSAELTLSRLDKKRKGVIRAIFRYLELKNCEANMNYVKAIACRAAGCDRFNEISEAGLTRIYNEFCRKQHTVASIDEIVKELRNMN